MKEPLGDSIKDFELLDKIGSGGFGKVFKARCRKSGYEDTYVAIKRISKNDIIKKKCVQRIKNEIKIHSKLSHPAIVKFYTSFEDNNYWYLVLELCSGGSFEDFVKCKQRLSEEKACHLIKQVFIGLQYLQLQQVIHRDLSLKNILLTENGDAKIADFGLAVKCRPNEKQTSNLGTANFMSPEVFMRKPYDFKVDYWSVGCILYALLYGAPPFDDKKRESIKYGVIKSELTFPDYASIEAIELLKDILEKDQNYRIEMKDALKYAFFQKYEKGNKKYEINSQRSGDSGMNSLSNSRSASSSQKIKRTFGRERKNNSVNSVHDENCSYEFSNSLGSRRSQNSDNSNLGYQRAKSPCNPKIEIRLESQCEVPIKCRPESPLYPHYFKNLIVENPATTSYNSCYNETDNNKKQESIDKERNMITRTNSHNNISKYSCSHDEYCLPEKNCHHKSSCYCRQSPVPIHKNNNTDHHSYEKERKHVVEIRNSSADNGLNNVLTPLNTVRLKPGRFAIKNAFVSILNDGQVCVEFLKLVKKKNYVIYVCFVSCDGIKISIFKPKKKILVSEKPPSLPKNTEEVQYYTFENLPKIHWTKYKYAKRFVDIVRAQTPKYIVYGKEAKYMMMENIPCPDFEANFYDGYRIRLTGNKITVMDQNGICLTDEKKLDTHVEFLLNRFENMKKKFSELETRIEIIRETLDDFALYHFPIIFGRRPDASPSSTHSSSSNRTISMKSYSGTINTDCSSFPNTSPASIQRPLSNRRGITAEKDITDIVPALKSQPSMKSYSDTINGDCSLFLNTSPASIQRPLSNRRGITAEKDITDIVPPLKSQPSMKSYSDTINGDCSPFLNTSPASIQRPLSNRRGITAEKDITDIVPPLKSQPSMKSYSDTINGDCSPFLNTSPASIQRPLSNRRGITAEKDITDIVPPLKSQPSMKSYSDTINGDCSLFLNTSPASIQRPLSNRRGITAEKDITDIVPPLKSQPSMKSYSDTINGDCSPFLNTSPASIQRPLSNRRGITAEKDITDIVPPLKSQPSMKSYSDTINGDCSPFLNTSPASIQRPLSNRRGITAEKDITDIVPPLKSQPSMKSYSDTINGDCSPFLNTSPASIQRPLSNRRGITAEKDITDIVPPLKSQPSMKSYSDTINGDCSPFLNTSPASIQRPLSNRRGITAEKVITDIVPPLKSQPSMKSYSDTINGDCSPFLNTSPASIQRPLSNRRGITAEKDITDIVPPLKSQPSMKSYSDTINGDCSPFLNTSPASIQRPLSNRRGITAEKDITYIVPALKSQPSMKSYSDTINGDCSPFLNTSPASIQSQLSNRKGITAEKDATDTVPALKSKPSVFKEWVIAEYEDNIQMWISLNGQVVFFCSMLTGERFSGDEHTKLMKRYRTDLPNILSHVLSEDVKKTK